MCGIVRVDESPGTVAALMRRGVRSPHIVACPLRMPDRSAPYYCRPAASTSCSHLMSVICCVCPITYVFNAMPARVPGEAMMGLMSGVLRMHGYARGPRATKHVAAPEPSRTRRRAWSHKTRAGTGALPGGGPGASVTW
jgi:hypothetical protein